MGIKATKLELSFSEMRALSSWLIGIMEHSRELAGQSIHYQIQLTILGDLLRKKVYPKTLLDTGSNQSIKMQPIEWMALQAAVYNGWNYCYDNYVQNVIRHLSMNQLPQLSRLEKTFLRAPDVWEEE